MASGDEQSPLPTPLGVDRPPWYLARNFCQAKHARDWAHAIKCSRDSWTEDFGGDQYSLGVAFYTHLETERAQRYFASVARMDRLVNRVLPGMQSWMDQSFASLVCAQMVRRRYGFAGAGVHVFLPGCPVAKRGGVVHVDTEGLAPIHLSQRCAAATLVVMLQAPEWGGGLRVWDVEGDHDGDIDSESANARTIRYRTRDALLMRSRLLHQIRPFRGKRARISATLHGVEVSPGVWETWF